MITWLFKDVFVGSYITDDNKTIITIIIPQLIVEQKKCNQGMIVDGWAEEQVSKWRIITITEEEQLDSKLLWSCLSGRKLYQLEDDAKHCELLYEFSQDIFIN